MKYLVMPQSESRRLPFYLAAEEWAARFLPPDEYFFAWRVKPTVICGRNQDMECEVDLDFCRSKGIDVVRRRSGGGAVLADMDNLMFSYIAPADEITTTFSHYTTMIAGMLKSLGINAEATGRNDIMVNGRKVAGNAFYHLPGRSIVHGTMLLNFDPELMASALTPSRAKLESKAVVSVPSRVTSLSAEGLELSPDELAHYARKFLCNDEMIITPGDVEAITKIEQAYYCPEFLNRRPVAERNIPQQHSAVRIDGIGEFRPQIKFDTHGRISSVDLSGDFFVCGDLHNHIFNHIIGKRPSELRECLRHTSPEKAIPGLTQESLFSILSPTLELKNTL